MPSHDGGWLDDHQRRAPVPPRVGEPDSEQPVACAEARTPGRAFQRRQLLSQGDVLKDQFPMSAASQNERADRQQDRLQHSFDCALRLVRISIRLRVGRNYGE